MGGNVPFARQITNHSCWRERERERERERDVYIYITFGLRFEGFILPHTYLVKKNLVPVTWAYSSFGM